MEPQKQDTQKPDLGSTRTRACGQKCGATCTETYVKYAEFGGRTFGNWMSSEWPAGYNCPACQMNIDAAEAVKREEAQKQARERRKRDLQDWLIKMLGGQRPFEECTFDRFDPLINFAAFQRVKNFNPLADNLFLYGPTGTGKTHLAVALAREQMERGIDVGYYKIPALMREFRRNLDPDDEERLITRLGMTAVLVIDDLGVGKATEYVIEKLHEVIDWRTNHYQAGLVITSNLSLNGIAETFKDRIADRLNGLCELVKMDGASHRGKKS